MSAGPQPGQNDDRWRRIEDLFHAAADLPPADRSAFLDRACAGDDQLRREVQSLLDNDAAESNVLADAVAQAAEQLPPSPISPDDELVGKRIGTYLITGLIGKGGMGRVFKAQDTQLNRTVAIKALPSDQFADAERKRRFLQEAKSTSSLNHPNIVTVHGIAQENGVDFLIMEYVPGKTLDQLIARKGLALKLALKYAIEIADALAVAHAAGIVHRDVKPSNVIVTETGRVKVLDFGLAKMAESPAQQDHADTGAPMTKAGLVFGTAAYMSPEQATGKPADARSDVFAFGAVLYEMVTGRRAFQGENVMSILADVLNREPPAPHTLAAGLPRDLERVIERCLRKDPERRIQSIADVKLELQEAFENLDSPSPTLEAKPPARRVWLAPALAALGLGLGAGAWFGLRIFHAPPVTYQRLTFRRGDVSMARFAPGGTVVYSAEWDGAPTKLFSVQPGNHEARDLELPSAHLLAVSPSGELAILTGAGSPGDRGTLAQVPLGGGAPRQVLEDVWAADWDPQGKSLAVVRTVNGHHRVEYPVGTVLYETQSSRAPLDVRISHKGDLVAFWDFSETGDYALAVTGANGTRQVLSKGWRAIGGLGWSPSGAELWFLGLRTGVEPALYAVDLSGRERILTEAPAYVTLCDVASDGRVLLAAVDSRIGIRSLGPGQKEERDLAWMDTSALHDMSDDGRFVLFNELTYGEGRNAAVYLRPTDGSPAVMLGYGSRPVLSHDGKWVACTRREADSVRIALVPTGPGEVRLLPADGIRAEWLEWFPDGKRLLVTGAEAGNPPRTYIRNIDGGKSMPVTPAGVRASRISPDSRFVVINNAGKLYRHPLDGGADSVIGPVTPGDAVLRWSSDGRYLFVQHNGPEERGTEILRVDVDTGRAEPWRKLVPPDRGATVFTAARISADGKSYAFSYQRDLATLYLVKGLK